MSRSPAVGCVLLLAGCNGNASDDGVVSDQHCDWRASPQMFTDLLHPVDDDQPMKIYVKPES
jgi:hypothetical protein